MIWWNLALFAVSFIATALLAPKPEIENARAAELDPDNFPKASEDSPIPLLLGCARIRGPNTLWYGNYSAEPIIKKQKTGLFSSTTITVGHEYFLSIDLGLCLGPAELKTIYIDSEPVDPGLASSFTEDFEFFEEEEGGATSWSGSFFNSQTGTITFSESYGASPAASGRGFTSFDMVVDLGLAAETIDGGNLTWEQEIGSNFISGIGSDTMNLFSRVKFFNVASTEIFSPDGVSAQTGTASYDPGTGIKLLTFDCTIPTGARTAEVQAWHTTLFPIFSSQAFGAHRIKVFGPNRVYATQGFDILEPELYGGRERGGGHRGNVQYYPGTFTQAQDTHVQTVLGDTNIPAYRGTAHLVMVNNNIGEQPSLRQMEFLMGRITNTLGLSTGGTATLANTDDISPAEALYLMMTDSWSGLDTPAAKVNKASLQAIGATLIAEDHGMSCVVSSPRQGKDVMREVLRQIDGVLAENQDGEVVAKLIRDDYTPASLTVYDEDDILAIPSYSRTSWRDVVSEVKVKFSDREKDSSRVALAQNMATLNMIGSRRTSEISFPFCFDATLANKLAARELARSSVPLIRLTAVMNRSAYQLGVGDVIKITFPELGLSELICRVQKMDLGELEDNRVTVELVQDVFAVSTTVMAEPESTDWVSDRPEPVTVPVTQMVEMPYFLGQKVEYPVSDGNGAVVPFPLRPQAGSSGFSLNVDDATGTLLFFEPEDVDYPSTGLLTASYESTAGFETGLDTTGFTIDDLTGDIPEAATTAEVRGANAGLMWANGEWMGYEGVTDNMDDTYTLDNVRRGLFGTRPLTHADNTRVWFLRTDLLGQGDLGGELLEDGTAYYKVLDQVGGQERAAVSESESTFALSDIADRPLRPRLLQLDGARTEVPFDASGDPTRSLTWLPSDRTETEVTFENDAAETPDQAEVYDLEVWVDGVQDMGLSDTNVTSPYALDLSTASGSAGELRLYSRRTGGDTKSSVYYAWYPFTLARATMDSTTVTMDDSGTTMDQTS